MCEEARVEVHGVRYCPVDMNKLGTAPKNLSSHISVSMCEECLTKFWRHRINALNYCKLKITIRYHRLITFVAYKERGNI
jgi:hypothetical protein